MEITSSGQSQIMQSRKTIKTHIADTKHSPKSGKSVQGFFFFANATQKLALDFMANGNGKCTLEWFSIEC